MIALSAARSANRSCFCLLCHPGWEDPDTLDMGIADHSVLPNRTSSWIPPLPPALPELPCPLLLSLMPSTLAPPVSGSLSQQRILSAPLPTPAGRLQITEGKWWEQAPGSSASVCLKPTLPRCLSLPCLYPWQLWAFCLPGWVLPFSLGPGRTCWGCVRGKHEENRQEDVQRGPARDFWHPKRGACVPGRAPSCSLPETSSVWGWLPCLAP